jgi:hypothetical protein
MSRLLKRPIRMYRNFYHQEIEYIDLLYPDYEYGNVDPIIIAHLEIPGGAGGLHYVGTKPQETSLVVRKPSVESNVDKSRKNDSLVEYKNVSSVLKPHEKRLILNAITEEAVFDAIETTNTANLCNKEPEIYGLIGNNNSKEIYLIKYYGVDVNGFAFATFDDSLIKTEFKVEEYRIKPKMRVIRVDERIPTDSIDGNSKITLFDEEIKILQVDKNISQLDIDYENKICLQDFHDDTLESIVFIKEVLEIIFNKEDDTYKFLKEKYIETITPTIEDGTTPEIIFAELEIEIAGIIKKLNKENAYT